MRLHTQSIFLAVFFTATLAWVFLRNGHVGFEKPSPLPIGSQGQRHDRRRERLPDSITHLPPHESPLAAALKRKLKEYEESADRRESLDDDAVARDSIVEQDATATQSHDAIIGVLTDPISLHTIGLAACMTWVRDVAGFADVIFFVGSCSNLDKTRANFPGRVECLDTPDTYPPQRKVFLMWSRMWSLSSKYSFFLKVDHDSYVNSRQLHSLLEMEKSRSSRQSECRYVGMPGKGRASEQKKLGLNGKKYCSGLGYMLSATCLNQIGPNLEACLMGAVSNHSDTEVGRCVMQFANTECAAVSDKPFKQVYYQQDGTHVYPMKLVIGGQMRLLFPREPKAIHFKAVVIHPLKRAEDFYRFHKQSMSSLRPVQIRISKNSPSDSYKMAIVDLQTTCVSNPLRQLERGGFPLIECQSPHRQSPTELPQHAFVLTGGAASAEYLGTASQLGTNNIQAIPVIVPRWGSPTSNSADLRVAHLQALFDVLKNASMANQSMVMILEDKVKITCDFKRGLRQLLDSSRCGGSLFTDQEGGVLLLGAEEPSLAGMTHIESDRIDAFAESSDVSAALCYNVFGEFSGSFAGLYHRAAYGELLSWISRVLKSDTIESIRVSAMYTHLADKGYIVRSAFPNLVLRETTNSSNQISDDARLASLNIRWYDGRYC